MQNKIKNMNFSIISSLKFAVGLLSLFLCTTLFAATFDTANQELRLPAVFDGEKTYTDVVIKLNANGTYSLTGTEESLPFQCGNSFSEATLGQINENMSIAEINSTLGCHWLNRSRQSGTIGGIDLSDADRFTWQDAQCTTISISTSTTVQDLLDKSISYTGSCALNPDGGGIYDMTSERFIIKTVTIDNALAAPNTILKFDTQASRWEIVSAEVVELGTPPHVCDLFTENTLATKLSSVNTIADIDSALGCQWTYKTGLDINLNSPPLFTYFDHECSSLMVFMANQQQISSISLDYNKVGCGF